MNGVSLLGVLGTETMPGFWGDPGAAGGSELVLQQRNAGKPGRGEVPGREDLHSCCCKRCAQPALWW